MYENDIYSGSGAGENTTGAFSGNNDFGNSNMNAGKTGTNFANKEEAAGSYGNTGSYGSADAYGSNDRAYTGNAYGSYQTGSSAFRSSVEDGATGGGKAKEPKAKKSGGFFRKAILSVSLGLCFGLFAGIGFYGVQQAYQAVESDTVDTLADTTSSSLNDDASDSSSTTSLAQTSNISYVESDVSEVVEEVMPAMVSIVNNYTETGTYFGRQYSQEQAASGSGIIVAETDEELLIVSNNHVVEDATTLEVTFIDGSTAEAQIKGTDADMDLAVIAISLDQLSTETREAINVATLGDSDSLKLGEPVIAIGNALGYGQSVTNGIVSALDREVTMEDGSVGTFIQTNAAINPGNSGGALLNIKGEVIGINSNKIGGTAVEGMGYAIPITSASPIISELMERQTRSKVAESQMGYIGIYMQDITSDLSEAYGFPEGIFIYDVTEDSAAEAAGIRKQDILVEFDGQKVTSRTELQEMMQYYAAGDVVSATVMRAENGEYVEIDVELTLRARPAE